MANHALPTVDSLYVDYTAELKARDEDAARQFDPAYTSPTNVLTHTYRLNSAAAKWQRWNGTSWVDAVSVYAINISGNAATATNASTVTNGVYTVGNQSIAGVKTFTSSIGVGAQPSSWGSDRVAVEAHSTSLFGSTFNGNGGIVSNAYWNGTNFVYKAGGGYVQLYQTFNGGWEWANATSGSAGNVVSFTPLMALLANGNLGIGTDSPLTRLHVNGGITSTGSADLPAQVSVTAYFTGGYASPVSGRLVFGDGTGWTYRFARRSAGTTTDLFTFTDTGNLLVGNTNGTSRITASGVIESTTGGFKFPDGTTQTTAASASSTSSVLAATAGATVGAVGTYAYLSYYVSAESNITAGTTVSGSSLRYAGEPHWLYGDTGNSAPAGTWRLMGHLYVTGTAQRARSLWLRIS